MLGNLDSENRKSNNCINWYGSDVPFYYIYISEKTISFYANNLT